MARHFRGTGHTLRFIEYMDVGTTNGWRLDDVVPAAEIVERIDAVFPLEPVEAGLPRRGRAALPLRRRRGRDRRHRLGHASRSAATARGRGSPPRGSSTPASSPPAAPTCARSSARAPRTTSSRRRSRRRLDAPRRPLLRDPHRTHLRAAADRDVLHRRISRSADRRVPRWRPRRAARPSAHRHEGGAMSADLTTTYLGLTARMPARSPRPRRSRVGWSRSARSRSTAPARSCSRRSSRRRWPTRTCPRRRRCGTPSEHAGERPGLHGARRPGHLDPYLDLVRDAKRELDIPVIASLNGSTPGGWIRTAECSRRPEPTRSS